MEHKYYLKVYNTITKKCENVEVRKEVYDSYRRSDWNLKDNDESFYAHEIQFSMLKGGLEGAFENFHEFVFDAGLSNDLTDMRIRLKNALSQLTDAEMTLIYAIYFNDISEAEYGRRTNESRQNVHNKRNRVLCKIYNLLELEK